LLRKHQQKRNTTRIKEKTTKAYKNDEAEVKHGLKRAIVLACNVLPIKGGRRVIYTYVLEYFLFRSLRYNWWVAALKFYIAIRFGGGKKKIACLAIGYVCTQVRYTT